MTSLSADRAISFADSNFAATLAQLAKLVRIPSVSWPSFNQQQLVLSAETIANFAQQSGVFDEVTISRSKIVDSDQLGQPAVLATRAAKNGAPTVLLYAHHDVQPPGDDEKWDSPPFQPTVRGERLYGRGAADDKAGVLVHLASLSALHAAFGDAFDLGISLFVEGEEEYGSASFDNFLDDHLDQLRADVIVVADSGNLSAEVPALTTSLRGAVRFTLNVKTLAHASHSGMFGGVVPDALMALVQILNSFWNQDGSVAVSGLTRMHDDALPYSEEMIRSETGLLDSVSLIGDGSILSRIWYQPSVSVTGVDAPSVANASNTLVPEASAVVSIRIAPNQSAADAFAAVREHLRLNNHFGAEVSITDVDLGEGFVLAGDDPVVDLALSSLSEAFGADAVKIGVGGSIPFISSLALKFPDARVLVTGIEDPDTRAHSPNESLHLPTFRNAIASQIRFLTDLSNVARSAL